ncbi:hypothetical protein KCMC57_up14150 [Kitasatospora sp. CMC57]|uniref:Uncharacterized protein n=1 Tax=Kitasatospora sp. CMC57 TaxID=3231513 RepID=A0AB33JUD8_9ACTN
MGRIKKKRPERDTRCGPGAPVTVPPPPVPAMEQVLRAWDRAVAAGLMDDGTPTKYH